ncbi:ABC transporter ATP-binding protein [uncultured Eubacterium sp.]|uniref:ABC transporter ATP-binding protein n=1 Tax=uncultured Eubacterium sp. TaxID=165185 RepID=UPI0015BC4B3E|nr:ABC transporter ATP-binding protein [uncultured Eubacterium sp.]
MNNKAIIKRISTYIGRYKILLILSMLLALVSVAGSLYIPVLIGNVIDFIIDKGLVQFDRIIPVLVRICVIIAVVAVSQWVMNVLNNKITFGVVRDMRDRAFSKIERLPVSYIDSHPSGEIVSRVIADVDQFADGLLMGFAQFFTGVITILGTLMFMLKINWWITIVVVIVTPLSFVIASFVAKNTHKMFKLQSETRGEQTAFIDEMVGNAKTVDAYSHAQENMQRFDEINARLQDYSLKAVFFSSITNPATRFVNAIVYACVAMFGAILAVNTEQSAITVGVLTCFLSYANQYTKPFNEISGVITELQNAFACAGRLFELLEEKETPRDSDNAVEIKNVNGKMELCNVSFSYTQNKKLIEDFNLSVKPGQRVAIVGPTGCGKTTLINLLMRFYDVNKGTIVIDDLAYDDVTRKSVRASFGMVLQDTWLKAGTIKDNIKMGAPDATDDEVVEAAKKAHSHSFIKRLPNGYDTVIGESGGSLSQGQRQLLCITRLMLCKPPMLILDEATSSIDTRTEIKIQKAFASLMQGRTTFIVAHRLATIKEADVILVMRDGNIVEQGTHKELLNRKGFYWELYNSQFPSVKDRKN